LTLLLSSCGGGGSSGDVTPGQTAPAPTTGPNSFLLFPNPQVQADSTVQTNTVAYATAYYAAVDPTNAKDTLPGWLHANGFATGGFAAGTTGSLGEVTATFGDQKDLGYGRRMKARQNSDGTIAVYVENYAVNAGAGYTYTPLNLDAAVVQDAQWHVGTNAIEFSPAPGGTWRFAKFYTFDPTPPYARRLVANLDGRGNKAMPGICISCHGGRADPLTPPTGSPPAPLFPLVMNSESQARGDTQARLQMLNADSFGYSSTAGYTRTDLEPAIKTINQMVLCTYPIPAMTANPEDACRQDVSNVITAPNQYAQNEWQGTAATALKAAYGGDGLPNAVFSDTYVPSNWLTAGQTTLYSNTLHPACITCHTLRGTGNQNDLDFDSYTKFLDYSDRVKIHVFDRGNMPLAKIVSEKFWATPNEYSTLANWLQGLGYTTFNGASVLQPGRPIADPGPDRTLRFGPTTLSATNSLYATGYSWSITTNPGNAGTLTNPTSATPQFTATANGTYVLQLIVSNGSVLSTPASLTLVVNNALTPDPAAIQFSDIKNVLQTAGCTTACHTTTAVFPRPPILYVNYDRNGDSVVDATDDLWFYTELRGRINFTDIVASPLLRKPSGHHHRGTPNGAPLTGFDASLTPGDPGRVNYDLFLNWILNGAPQ
jgi:hypothetical protein